MMPKTLKEQEELSFTNVSGNCFLLHKWSTWVKFEQPMMRLSGQKYVEICQQRRCLRCGKYEIEKID